ncbi:uncharacterized protein LOC124285145 isoform X1 [Haliotis rubra]|uniref:uncharacterized protein LOC124285145 isoform X1 n=1 Tax=Haliotis rubra TaxID=36100 RepID=UPI001EE5332B|nr:uncharacterized protein LOC124285145 isoform X1 [Haliotis rubra]
MEVLTVMFFSLVVFGIRDVQAAPTLTARVAVVEEDLGTWKLKTVDIIASMNALTRQVGLVSAEVDSVKANAQNIKTRLNTITQELRRVQQERDTYRKSLRKLRRMLTKDLGSLQLQLDQTAADLCDQRTTTYPGTTAASTDPSPSTTVPPAPVTTQDSDLHASTDPSPNTTVPPTPVTTQDSDPHATPSPAAGRRLYSASRAGDLERVKRILAAGHVDINTRGDYSKTPVMAAALGDTAMWWSSWWVEGLMCRWWTGAVTTSFTWPVMVETWRSVKLIVSRNVVDINARNNYGRTAVYYARRRGHQRVVEFLVSRGGH